MFSRFKYKIKIAFALFRLQHIIRNLPSILRNQINFALALLKWPCALAALVAVPAVCQTMRHYYYIRAQLNWHALMYFGIGIAFFAATRVIFLLKHGSAETLEHEMTHVLFALLTCHPVTNMEVKDGGGGSMSFLGKGNWLIAIAPYFFPLAALTMMFFCIAITRILGFTPEWVLIALGAAFCYNVFSFVEQIHPRQTDFKAAGYLFSICFIPGANFVMFGAIFAFIERGFSGMIFFFELVWFFTKQNFHYVLSLM